MRDISEASISEEDFAELWDLWFDILPIVFLHVDRKEIIDFTYKFRDINHKYNLGLVEE